MVVAAKSRAQTNHRMLDLSGAAVGMPGGTMLAVLLDMGEAPAVRVWARGRLLKSNFAMPVLRAVLQGGGLRCACRCALDTLCMVFASAREDNSRIFCAWWRSVA